MGIMKLYTFLYFLRKEIKIYHVTKVFQKSLLIIIIKLEKL